VATNAGPGQPGPESQAAWRKVGMYSSVCNQLIVFSLNGGSLAACPVHGRLGHISHSQIDFVQALHSHCHTRASSEHGWVHSDSVAAFMKQRGEDFLALISQIMLLTVARLMSLAAVILPLIHSLRVHSRAGSDSCVLRAGRTLHSSPQYPVVGEELYLQVFETVLWGTALQPQSQFIQRSSRRHRSCCRVHSSLSNDIC
jgi:hypothetical protein